MLWPLVLGCPGQTKLNVSGSLEVILFIVSKRDMYAVMLEKLGVKRKSQMTL